MAKCRFRVKIRSESELGCKIRRVEFAIIFGNAKGTFSLVF